MINYLRTHFRKSTYFRDHNLAVSEATTIKTFRKAIVEFCESLDFATISALVVYDRPDGSTDFYSIDNTPPAYLEAYADRSLARIDPVMQHCKRTDIALVWDQETYVAGGAGSLWEYQARFGYKAGIAHAFHGMGGQHFFLGVDRPSRIKESADALGAKVRRLVEFSSHAQEAAIAIWKPHSSCPENASSLSNLECEILRWSMDGASCEEIGKILSIACDDVSRLILSATRKLNCVSKYQAVIKAIRLGLLN